MWVMVLIIWILLDFTTIDRVLREGMEYHRCWWNESTYWRFLFHRSPAQVVYGPDRVVDSPEDDDR